MAFFKNITNQKMKCIVFYGGYHIKCMYMQGSFQDCIEFIKLRNVYILLVPKLTYD